MHFLSFVICNGFIFLSIFLKILQFKQISCLQMPKAQIKVWF